MTETELEDTTVETELADASEGEAVKTAEPSDTTVYTPEKQMLDQERANRRRIQEDLENASAALEEATERTSQLEAELAQIKAAHEAEKKDLQAQQQRLEDMDPELVDKNVIANIQRLERLQKEQESVFQKQMAEKDKQIQELLGKASAYEQERDQLRSEEDRRATREAVLSRVETSLTKMGVAGAGKYRSEALKLADELVDSGQVRQPQKGEFLYAVDLIEDCYLKIHAKHSKGKEKTVSVDTGKSGVAGAGRTQRKAGTLDEVADDMLKDTSWLKGPD